MAESAGVDSTCLLHRNGLRAGDHTAYAYPLEITDNPMMTSAITRLIIIFSSKPFTPSVRGQGWYRNIQPTTTSFSRWFARLGLRGNAHVCKWTATATEGVVGAGIHATPVAYAITDCKPQDSAAAALGPTVADWIVRS